MSSDSTPVLEPAVRQAHDRADSTGAGERVQRAPSDTVRVGIIGYGYWGPNIVRNFHGLDNCEVVAVCDKSPAALKRAQKAYPHTRTTSDFNEILTSPEIDAVAVITPVWTHFDLAKAALENGKHVFVEKPFTSTSAQAEQLIELADRKNLKIMVDHTFLFSGAVRKIREVVDAGKLGSSVLLRLDPRESRAVSARCQRRVGSRATRPVGDGPHHHGEAEAVVATGAKHLNGHADMAFITIYFPRDIVAHINVNWLSPVKVRTTLIGGKDKMLVWNDLEADEKIKIYDKGVEMTSNQNPQGVYDLLVSYRTGDVWAPKVEQTEALKVELGYFVDCIVNDRVPLNDGAAGLRVVRLLEAADESLKAKGKFVSL